MTRVLACHRVRPFWIASLVLAAVACDEQTMQQAQEAAAQAQDAANKAQEAATAVVAKVSETALLAAKAGVKSDLRNLATVQEVFFADSSRYASDAESLREATGYMPVSPVDLTVRLVGQGYVATMTHRQFAFTCRLTMNPSKQDTGVPVCDGE